MVDLPFLATPLAGNTHTSVVGQEATVLSTNMDSNRARDLDASTRPDVETVNEALTQTKAHSYVASSGSEGLVLSPRPTPFSAVPSSGRLAGDNSLSLGLSSLTNYEEQ